MSSFAARLHRLGFTSQDIDDARFELRIQRIDETLVDERATDQQLRVFVSRVLVVHHQKRGTFQRPGLHRDSRRPGDTQITRTQGGSPGLGRRR